jgi:hypothetical protein
MPFGNLHLFTPISQLPCEDSPIKNELAKNIFRVNKVWKVNKLSSSTSLVKLIFIHHSCGGNWLADENEDPYGELGIALMNNNYFVSATNYEWGTNSIGSRTDIPNWPEWFTGPDSSTYLNELYNESDQNIGTPSDWWYFGDWSRRHHRTPHVGERVRC